MSRTETEEVKDFLVQIFHVNPNDIIVNVDGYSDVYLINNVSINFKQNSSIYVGCKKITSGGGDNSESRSRDERRIQIKSTSVNYLFEKQQKNNEAILIGYDNSNSEKIVFSSFKIAKSNASESSPVSFQIKQETISRARLIGFAQQDKRTSFACAFVQSFFNFYLEYYHWLHDFDFKYLNSNVIPPENSNKTDNDEIGSNILLYGVAGVGKSFNVKQITGKDESVIERIVFHPDYLNTDFIGQILPSMEYRERNSVEGDLREGDKESRIVYDFKAGPFTRILKKAILDPSNHYYLAIEEINRGNAPAIFGEVFQLLDRKDDGSSTYRISHDLMAKEIFDDPNRTIYIPNNLTILATMNTADQNVFTLDTAFQRRWTMRMIENNIENCDYKNVPVLDTDVSWQKFNTVINEHILEVNKDTLSSEDKRLGAFFIRADELKLPTDLANGIPFAEKVIKYLWDDVFKFNKFALFKSELNSLDKVLREFKKNEGFSRFNIFNDDIQAKLKQGQQSPSPQASNNSNEI